MPRGDKSSYTTKQRRQAKHIEDSEEKSGKSAKRAKQIAYATVNKQSGGGKKSGSGRKGGRKGSANTSHLAHVRAGKKAARTRERHAHR